MSGINMDYEFRQLVEEEGWWMVLRCFDLTKRSTYWNEDKKEAVGGPEYKYHDLIFRGRRVEHVDRNPAEQHESRGMLTDIYRVKFYILSKIRPKREDMIIEIPVDLRHLTEPPKKVNAYEVFNIVHVEHKFSMGLSYSICYAIKETPRNDATLNGPLPVKYITI